MSDRYMKSFMLISVIIAGFVLAFIYLLFAAHSLKYILILVAVCLISSLPFLFIDKEKFFIVLAIFLLPFATGVILLSGEMQSIRLSYAIFELSVSDVVFLYLFFWILLRIFTRQADYIRRFLCAKPVMPFFLWVGACLLSLLPAINRFVVFIETLNIIRIGIIFFCVFCFIRSKNDIQTLVIVMYTILIIQAVIIILQSIIGIPFTNLLWPASGGDYTATYYRPGGTLGHSSHYAKMAGVLLPVVLADLISPHTVKQKILLFALFFLGCIALVATISRAAIVATFFCFVLFSMRAISRQLTEKKKRVGVVLCFTLIGLLLGGTIFLIGGSKLRDRISHDYGSAASRRPMFQVALNVIKTHPLFGVGLNNYILAYEKYDTTRERISRIARDTQVHNLYLLFAAEIGIPGLIFFLWFMFSIIQRFLNVSANKQTDAWMRYIFLGMAIGLINLLLQSITGLGVTRSVIHLALVAIFAGIVSKQPFLRENSCDDKNIDDCNC